MLFVISSGNGVDEVCRGVWHFVRWLEKLYSFKIVDIEYAKCLRCYKSVVIKSDDDKLRLLEGTILWHTQSPFRVKHKRKNWYFGFWMLDSAKLHRFDSSKIVYQSMKSPKKGGQHVNTTNTGVRAIYPPLNLEVVSYEQRSQHLNKQIASKRLEQKVQEYNLDISNKKIFKEWKDKKSIQRGEPILVFRGLEFKDSR